MFPPKITLIQIFSPTKTKINDKLFIKGYGKISIPFFLHVENSIFADNNFTKMRKINFDIGIFKILRNKWIVTSILFLVWIFFFDENSIVSHQKNKRRLFELKQQEEYYKERIEVDKQKLIDIEAGEEKLEKFAREQYFMSKSDEDVFVIVDHD